MRTSVIITSYNYADYICEAIESALNQTRAPDEVIVVDDGSTDNSTELVKTTYADNSRVKLIAQENAGQMASFNTGIEHSTGDIIFFLDSDDLYAETHIEKCLEAFSQNPSTELLFTAYKHIGRQTDTVYRFSKSGSRGYSPIAVYFARYWAGSISATLVIRRSLANRVFPYDDSWSQYSRANGDLPLVYGSSILGARKYYLREATVAHRTHEKNATLNTLRSNTVCYELELLTSKVTEHYWKQSGLSKEVLSKALAEFKTIQHPSKEELKVYQRLILRSPQPVLKRLEQWFSAWKYFKRTA